MDFAKIAHEINTQDNRATEDPLFCVFEKERIYGLHGDYSDRFEYDKETGEKVYYVERDKFVNAHFTEAAAKEHIRINGHNLKSPFVYVTSMWRCPEMIAIRKALSNNQAPALPEPMREEPEESLYCLGENLIKAAYKYWQKYQQECGPDAVVYLKDTSGHMVLFTRGEYSNIIMKNIENLSNEKPLNDPFTVEA